MSVSDIAKFLPEYEAPPHLLGRVHQVDCLPFMRKLPERCVDLIVTSPPYNYLSGGLRAYSHRKREFNNTGYDVYKDDLPEAEYMAKRVP